MSAVIIIPARHASTRYPGKPLVELAGASGQARSLIRRSWDAAMAVSGVDRVIVATDDDRIADRARGFGAEVAMTSTSCRNGTERCAEAMAALDLDPEIVVNLQGDAPLTPAWFVEELIAGAAPPPGRRGRDSGSELHGHDVGRADGRPHCRSRRRHHGRLRGGRCGAVLLEGGHSVRAGRRGGRACAGRPSPVFHHVGVYAYRPAPLALTPPGPKACWNGLRGWNSCVFWNTGGR